MNSRGYAVPFRGRTGGSNAHVGGTTIGPRMTSERCVPNSKRPLSLDFAFSRPGSVASICCSYRWQRPGVIGLCTLERKKDGSQSLQLGPPPSSTCSAVRQDEAPQGGTQFEGRDLTLTAFRRKPNKTSVKMNCQKN